METGGRSIAYECERLGRSLDEVAATVEVLERHAVAGLVAADYVARVRVEVEKARSGGLGSEPTVFVAWAEALAAMLEDLDDATGQLVRSGRMPLVPREPIVLTTFLEDWFSTRISSLAGRVTLGEEPPGMPHVEGNPVLLRKALDEVIAYALGSKPVDGAARVTLVSRAREMAGLQIECQVGSGSDASLGSSHGGFGLWQAVVRNHLARQRGLLALREDVGPRPVVLLLLQRVDQGRE